MKNEFSLVDKQVLLIASYPLNVDVGPEGT